MFEKREYPELAGKEIIFEETTGKQYAGEVVSVDYWIGYTVVEKGNPDQFLVCGKGPKAPNRGNAYDRGQADIDEWDEMFDEALGKIVSGRYKSNAVNDMFHINPTSESCPFGQ